MWAVRSEDASRVRSLLRDGAQVDQANVNGVTALQLACQSGNAAMIKLLLDAGADREKRDGAGETP
jgi:ankyrin repeat protein